MYKKEMIAMLLAGGQGSRLGVLTSKVAKPAVAFGGKYRIIDFPFKQLYQSGVDTVGVLTQYQPLRLELPISASAFRGIWIAINWEVLPFCRLMKKSKTANGILGTANAIYQNLAYMESFNPDYVLILSGDHIYKMDYEVMLDFHKSNGAEGIHCRDALFR